MTNKLSIKSGLAPGTPVYVGTGPPEETHVTLFSLSTEHSETLPALSVSAVFDFIEQNPQAVWIHVQGLRNTEMITELCLKLHIHPLVIEDILNTHQRPKIDFFTEYFYATLRLRRTELESKLSFSQMSILVMPKILITFLEQPSTILDNVQKRLLNPQSILHQHTTDYLAYTLMDTVVDDYFNILEKSSDTLEILERNLIHNPNNLSLSILYVRKREIINLRKAALPLKDMVSMLLKTDSPLIHAETRIYLHDLFDHCLRLIEITENHRELAASMVEIYLSSINNKMNETIKVLTLFTAIFTPITFLAGLYGMNFHNIPELSWPHGYFYVLALMGSVTTGVLLWFKHKKWI